MKVIGQWLLLAVTISVTACGSFEPGSPLILGRDPDVSLGPRALTPSQRRALQKVITADGEACGAISQAVLVDLDPAGREAWEVQCTEGRYSVQVRADGTPSAAVQRCFADPFGGSRCNAPLMRAIHRDSRQPEGPLNPDLQKLLEPLTAKDGKVDK